MFSSIEDALIDYAKGKIIIVVDDENRENEGDMICAADFSTPENINFMAQNARGLICVAIDKTIASTLDICLSSIGMFFNCEPTPGNIPITWLIGPIFFICCI